MLAHFFGESTHPDASKVVDGKASVPRSIGGEDTSKAGTKNVIPHSFLKLLHAQGLGQLLEEDLDEDTAA
jgi:hypothetical protein